MMGSTSWGKAGCLEIKDANILTESKKMNLIRLSRELFQYVFRFPSKFDLLFVKTPGTICLKCTIRVD